MWQRTPAQQQQQPESRVLCKPQFSIQLFLVAVAAVACIKCSRSLARPRNEADGRQAGRPAPLRPPRSAKGGRPL